MLRVNDAPKKTAGARVGKSCWSGAYVTQRIVTRTDVTHSHSSVSRSWFLAVRVTKLNLFILPIFYDLESLL